MNKMTNSFFDGKDAVVCLDIGGSECSGFILYKVDTEHTLTDSAGKIMTKYISSEYRTACLSLQKGNHNIDTVLYRYMTRNGEQTVIGTPSDRSEDTNILNFKMHPPYKDDKGWDNIHPSSSDPEKTHKYYMHLFLEALWTNIRKHNSGDEGVLKNIADDKIAIYVGCPSSENWTAYPQRKQYEQLISDATGIKAVRVVPESTAGVFRAVSQRKNTNNPIDPKKGIMVIDVGSVTLDSTYMRMGDILVENSWTLGASAIEHNILKYIDSIYADTELSAGEQETRQYLLRKKVKERYFEATNQLNDLLQSAENYNPENYSDSIDRDAISFDFTDLSILKRIPINSELIDNALALPTYGVYEGGKPDSEYSKTIPQGLGWKEYFSLFIRRNIEILEEKYCDVDYVILTGGASRMYFIRDICLEEFAKMEKRRRDNGRISIFIDPNPSDSVGYGLIQTARNDYAVTEVYNSIFEKSKHGFYEPLKKFKEKMEYTASSMIMDAYKAFLRTCPDKMLREDFERELKKYFKSELSSDNYKKLYVKQLEVFKDQLISKFCEFSNAVSAKLYNDENCFCVPANTIEKLVVDEISTINNDIDALDISDLADKYTEILAGSLLILSFIPLAAIEIGLLLFDTVVEIFTDEDPETAANFADWYIRSIDKLGEQKVNVKKQLEKLQSDIGRYEIKKKISDPITKSNTDSIIRELFGEKNEKYDDLITNTCHKIATYIALIDFPERHSY